MDHVSQADVKQSQHISEKKPVNSGVIHSQDIFNGEKVVLIKHGEQHYQLRQTKENKLILTK